MVIVHLLFAGTPEASSFPSAYTRVRRISCANEGELAGTLMIKKSSEEAFLGTTHVCDVDVDVTSTLYVFGVGKLCVQLTRRLRELSDVRVTAFGLESM